MIGVKAQTNWSAHKARLDPKVQVILAYSLDRSGGVELLVFSNKVAEEIGRDKIHWSHLTDSVRAPFVFRIDQSDIDRVAEMLNETLPDIERWESR